jgi:uncharacterized membrane protein YfcA
MAWHPLDPTALAVVAFAVFLITFMKGMFGGGFAIVGIPFMALVMDPIAAGALLAPVLCLSDIVALRYWRPSTWSKPDLILLMPGQLLGIGAGYLFMRIADRHLVAVVIALVTLWFAGLWFAGGGQIGTQPRSSVKGVAAGVASGIGSMIAHSGGPPVAMYLLPLGLSKSEYAGTTFVFFIVGNLLKAGPWLALVDLDRRFWTLLVITLPVIVLGVWSGWRLHDRLDQVQLYRACYALLMVVALKLLWDGTRGYALL